MTPADIDRLLALADASDADMHSSRRTDANNEFMHELFEHGRELCEAYTCLRELVAIRTEAETSGPLLEDSDADAIRVWKRKWDVAFTNARRIVGEL